MDNYWLLSSDISNNEYKLLLKYLIEHSDAFQLVVSKNKKNVKLPACSKRIVEVLKEDRVGGWSKTGDYQLPMTEGTTKKGCYCTTIVFQTSKLSLDELYRPKSLYSWGLPDYPEDLSFFRNGYSWFATCSSEKMTWLCAEKNEISEICRISKAVFERAGPCDKSTLFYEKYRLRPVKEGTANKAR